MWCGGTKPPPPSMFVYFGFSRRFVSEENSFPDVNYHKDILDVFIYSNSFPFNSNVRQANFCSKALKFLFFVSAASKNPALCKRRFGVRWTVRKGLTQPLVNFASVSVKRREFTLLLSTHLRIHCNRGCFYYLEEPALINVSLSPSRGFASLPRVRPN